MAWFTTRERRPLRGRRTEPQAHRTRGRTGQRVRHEPDRHLWPRPRRRRNFYASRYSHRDVYSIAPSGSESPFAGVHLASGCLDGPRLSAKFIYTAGVTVHDGTLFIADQSCHTIRAIDLTNYVLPAATSTWGRVKTMYR